MEKFWGKCWLNFRHVGFGYRWEIRVSISSRQLHVQIWSSEEEHVMENSLESNPSNVILKIMGEDKILSFCIQPSSLFS